MKLSLLDLTQLENDLTVLLDMGGEDGPHPLDTEAEEEPHPLDTEAEEKPHPDEKHLAPLNTETEEEPHPLDEIYICPDYATQKKEICPLLSQELKKGDSWYYSLYL